MMQESRDSKDSSESTKKKYRVSVLDSKSSSSVTSLPLIKISRPRRNDIYIPSVHKSEEIVTPRSADSKSIDESVYSNLSRKLHSGHGSRGSSRGKITRSGSPFKHPVSAGKQSIGVEIDNTHLDYLTPSTKLDILEALLPRDLRNPHKFKTQMHNRIRASILLDEQNKVNHVSRLLQREQIIQKDYKPIHYSSGGLSVDTYPTNGGDSKDEIDNDTADSLDNDDSMDGGGYDSFNETPLPRSMHETPALSSPVATDINNVRVQSPYENNTAVRRTVVNKRASGARRDSLWIADSNKKRELLIDREERCTLNFFMADLERSLKAHQEEEEKKQQQERQIILQLKTINTLFDKNYSLAGALIATAQRLEAEDKQKAIEDAIKRGAELEHSLSTRYHLVHEDDDDKSIGGESEDSFTENDELGYQKKLKERALMRAMHALQLADNQSQKFVDKMQELTNRKMKDKLKHLAKYINSHTSRKIMDCWNVIEGRFKSSNFTKVVMTTNSSGLTHPVKHPALFVSTLTSLLCSAKVKVGHQELFVLLDKIGIPMDDIFHARQIAALNLVISYDMECKLKETTGYKVDLQVLMRKEEKLISLHELMEAVFPINEEERAKEMDNIKSNRQAEIQAVMDEKKRKEEKKESLERRRKQLIHDFETSLDQYQIMKGKFNRDRHNEFVYLVNHCVRTIAQHYENESAKISLDVMSFIGMDAFPQGIQNKINKNKRPLPALPRENPLLKKNIMARKEALNIALPHGEHMSASKAPTPCASASPSRSTSPRASSASISENPRHSATSLTKGINRDLIEAGKSVSQQNNDIVMPVNKALEVVKAVVRAPVGWEKLKLFGPPTVVAILRETISFGKGLNGYPYRDVVACLQYIAVTKITAFFRGHSKNWRYFAARLKWRKIDADIRCSHFMAWKHISIHNVNTNKYCFRKLKAWQFYTKRAIYRRNVFRQCFWMFYTWRKFTDASATAKEKAFFLVHRVMPTVLKIKIFRGWKRYTQLEVKLNKAADKYCASLLRKRFKESFLYFYDWFRRRRHIRKAWFRRGAQMRKVNLYRIRIAPFLIWYIYAKYRKLIRNRVKSQFYEMKKLLFHNRHPIRAMSYIEQRMLFVRKKIQGAAKTKVSKKKSKKLPDAKKKPSSSQSSRKSVTPNSKAKPKRRLSLTKPTSAGNASGVDSDTNTSIGADSVETTDDEGSVTKAGSETEESKKKEEGSKLRVLKRPFDWKANTTAIYDIDSGGEDNEDLGIKMTNAYNKIAPEHEPVPEATKFDFIDKAEYYIQKQAKSYHDVYNYCDIWNTFEAACRFHRVGFRAFNNLRQYAKIRKRVRKHHKRVRLGTLKSYFQMLKVNAKYVARRLANTSLTEAEQINSDVRYHIVGKLNRLRQTTELVNRTLGRDTGDVELDDEARAVQKMKYLNMISEDNDEEYIAAELKRRKENQAEAKRKSDLIKNNTALPNLLEFDRADREKEERYANVMVEYGKESKNIGLITSELADQQSKEKLEKQNKIVAAVKLQLDSETNVTSTAISNQDTFVNLFKVHAADNLITALAKIYVEIQINMMREETRLYFRALRVPMLLTRSRSMYRRKKLINWIRICMRLNSISRHAKFYADKRCLWVTLNRWLKFMEIEKLNPTPGLASFVRRKLLLHPCYHELLERKGFKKVPYCNNDRLKAASTEIGALFSRWKTETQESILFRVLSEKVHDLYILKLKQKIFYALRTGFNVKEIIRLIRNDPPLFPMVRMLADVSIIGRKFLSSRKKTVNATIAKYNRTFVHKLKIDGKNAMSFKKFMYGFENETSQRISSEQRILSESFEQRGKQEFFDCRCPQKNDPIIPAIMSKMDGKAFSDPQYIASDGKDITIPGGFRLHKIKIVLQSGLGVMGWQCIWAADGARDIEGPQRGNWNCSAMSMQEFTVPKEDYLIGIEYMYDGGTIVAVRMKYLNHGFTSWAGSKTSLSTLSVFLGTEIAPKLLFESDRDKYLDPEEIETPAYPSNYVIGLTGITNGGRATCLGIVVRKIKKQNIFSYYYVGDVLAKVNAHANDFAAMHMQPKHKRVTHGSQSDAGSHKDSDSVGGSSVQDSQVSGNDTQSESAATANDDSDDSDSDGESHTTATGGNKGEDGSGTGEIGANEIELLGKRRHGVLKQRTDDEPLTRSEEEFFDVLRMRTTELADASERVVDFARRLWTSKEIRNNPMVNKLINIRVISHLSQWYFNTISKRLIKVSHTEKQALVLQKTARQHHFQAIKLQRRSESTALQAKMLERTKQPWTGKSMLGPQERAAKKEHIAKVNELKDLSARYENESFEMRKEALEYEKESYALLPRISLSMYVFNNYKIKIQAARHKASLLERMTLDDIKSGLFGTDSKDNLLNKEQMNAIHASLMNQKIVLNDETSLSRLIDDVLAEEGAILEQEEMEARRLVARLHRKNVPRHVSLASGSLSLSLGSSSAAAAGVVSGIALEDAATHAKTGGHKHHHGHGHGHGTHSGKTSHHHHAAAGHVHHKVHNKHNSAHQNNDKQLEGIAEAGVIDVSSSLNRERSLTLNSVETEDLTAEKVLPPKGKQMSVTHVSASHKAHNTHGAKKMLSSNSATHLSRSAKY